MKKMILEELEDQLNNLESDATKAGYEDGFQAGLATQLKSLTFKDGDVVVIKNANLNRRVLESLRVQFKQFGVRAVLGIQDEAEIGKLSDINLGLLGLERRK